MMALLTDPQAWAALVTLSALEVVLGIDNVVFISILVARLQPDRRATGAAGRVPARARPAHRLSVRPDEAGGAVRADRHAARPGDLVARRGADRRRAVSDRQG